MLSSEKQLLGIISSFLQTTTIREILNQVMADLVREEGIKFYGEDSSADKRLDEDGMGEGGCGGRRRKRQVAAGLCVDSRTEVEEEDAKIAEEQFKRY